MLRSSDLSVCSTRLQRSRASILATRLRPYAVRYLHSVPQFAYLGGRSLQQALDRVVSHCAEVRGLAATQNRNPFAYRQGRETLAVVGRIQLSLDISKAYDCVRRADLKAALQDADVPPDLVSLVLAIHHQALLRVQHGGRSADLPLRVGLRQGCGLSPLLWAVFSGWVLRRLDGEGPGQVTVADTNTTFADDFHFAWLVRSGAALEKAYRDIKAVLAHLEAHRLQISVDKTVVMVELRGNKAATLLRKYTIKTDKGTLMRFQVNSRNIDIKIVTQHTYLGVCISYHKFEQETVAKRIKLAQVQFARLKSVLKCQAVALPLRLRLWKACVPPCLLHGLDCTGFTTAEAKQLTTLLAQQARMIAKSYSVFTKESNAAFMARLQVAHPVTTVAKALADRIKLDDWLSHTLQPRQAQQQWRNMLKAYVSDASAHRNTQPVPSSVTLQLVGDAVHEVFECDICGQQFATAAARKRHQFLAHMTEPEQVERKEKVRESSHTAPMEHAKEGMPWCRHCLKKFNNWPNFYYHVNSRSCDGLRDFLSRTKPRLGTCRHEPGPH